MGPPLRLLWCGPTDTSRPGGWTRGSAPTSIMGRAYRHIATRRADTWVRPYVYYGAGLQTHRDPAGGHVGPPLRLLWGGPIDASRPGGRTRGSSAPTNSLLRRLDASVTFAVSVSGCASERQCGRCGQDRLIRYAGAWIRVLREGRMKPRSRPRSTKIFTGSLPS